MENYKSLHLAWVKSHPTFVPKYSEDYTLPYYDILRELYNHPACSNEFAKKCLVSDLDWKKKSEKLLNELYFTQPTKHFVTIGFNHQTWTVGKCVALIQNILTFDWITGAKCVFEKHRENGEHPHVHLLIDSILPKSKILEKIWAAKGIKKLVLKKSFIDYKPAMDYHEKYILGDKQEAKIPYIEKDRIWRQENQINHLYEK
jgi:hypothetical protein